MNRPLGNEDVVELRIPSRRGYEKVVMAAAAVLAKDMGLPVHRIEDLCTALSEAILNAMEHGNQMNSHLEVIITLTQTPGKLSVSIRDQGKGFIPPLHPSKPSIEEKVSGIDSSRGWGWFLIKQLVDQVEVSPTPGGGTNVHLIVLMEGTVQQDG